MDKIYLYHPNKWGDGYYLNLEDKIPFKQAGEQFIEVFPINTPKDWYPRIFSREEVVFE